LTTRKSQAESGVLRTELIYEALTDENALRRLPSKLAAAVGARSAVLQFADSTGQADVFAYSYFSPAVVNDYLRNFVGADLWANAAYSSPRNQGRAVILNELVPDEVFERSVLWNEFFRSHRDDTFRCLGSAIPVANGFGLIGIHRAKREPEFQPREAAILNAALPHMRRLFTVRSALLQAKAQALLAHTALSQLSTLALAIDHTGRVLAAQPENAEDLLRAADGIGFRNKRLHFQHGLQAQWEELLAKATLPSAPSGGAMLLGLRTSGKVPVWLEISPTPALPPPMCAIVIIRTAVMTPDLTRRRLRRLFGLTTAEADVAYLASQGASADEIAGTRSVAVTTVRAQIRGIFDKLECRSLSQLAMIVARLSG
jgi:DNA-binding CsgD family transcriptional regulator